MSEVRRATVALAALVALAVGGAGLATRQLSPLLSLPIDLVARFCRLPWAGSSAREAADFPLLGMLGLGLVLGALLFALSRLGHTLRGLGRIERLLAAVPDLGTGPAALRVRSRACEAGLAAHPLVVADLGERPAAFTVGLLRPRIVVSPAVVDALTDAELDALLLHEAAHVRRRDPLRLIVAGFCRDLLFFLPISHLLYAAVREAQEQAADDIAAESAGPLEVAGALIAFLRVAGGRATPGAVAGAVGADPEARIRRLLGAPSSRTGRGRSLRRSAGSFLISGVLLAGLLSAPGASQAALAACCGGAPAAYLAHAASC